MVGETITQTKLLLVEGRDEENFFAALIKHLGISGIQIVGAGGERQFKQRLAVITSTSGFREVTAIGVVRDADEDREKAFESVCSRLRDAGLSVPKEPMVFSDGGRKTIVMIMPPQEVGTNRMLEDVCLESVKGDPATRCVQGYFACLEEESITHEANAIAKAKLHVFLAFREQPDLRLGEAAQKGYWPWDDPAFDKVKDFLQQLASD